MCLNLIALAGILCGRCKPGLSLSLGSSRCMPCSNKWIAFTSVITAGILSGVLLVTLLLLLNLTVAVGTLNGVIFHVNIVGANGGILFPFSKPNLVTVFVAWLNLEIGFDTCFIDGMDTYWKT